MKKHYYLVALMLILNISVGFSQTSNQTNGSLLNSIKVNRPSSDTRNATTTDAKYMTQQEMFENLKLTQNELSDKNSCFHSITDRLFISQNDSVRIKYVFNKHIKSIRIIEGPSDNLSASPRDLMKGEWIAVIKPEKTMTMVVEIENMQNIKTYDKWFVLVLDSEEYEETSAIQRMYDFFKKDRKGFMEYFWKLAGEDGVKFKERLNSPFKP